ncbi:CHAT domain-containing protein [Nostoc sp. 2RC]|uniref:CHAT domain-containing protein n=1 Tax=Nostoc sp. 2RC TaxID=2485484 RepID=UPI001C8AB8BF|nr:CHAT domain-containing protein [Nostoc sp. 2RC]
MVSFDSLDELKDGYELALAKWRQGDLAGAFHLLLEIFTYRLLDTELIDADLKVIQSLADLASFFGEFQIADDLLCGAVGLYENADSECWADYTRLRRIQLSLDKGDLHLSKLLLQEMASRIGDIDEIQFSTPGLIKWELSCIWRNTEFQDRTVLFAELYLVMGRLLSALGQYAEALVALHQGLSHTEGKEIPSLAQQTVIPLKLAVATAHLEKGNFNHADNYLSDLDSQLIQQESPEYLIRWFELSGKLCLLQGELGKGLKQFQKVQEICSQLRSQQAQLRSTLNLAHILILLNQTSTAQSYLNSVQSDASTIGNSALVSRAELLLSLAQTRSRSLVEGSPVALTVIGMLGGKHKPQSVVQEDAKLDLSSPSANFLTWFEDRALAFHWQLSDYNLQTAGKLLKQIKTVFQHTDSRLIQVQIRVLEGIFAYYQGVESKKSDVYDGLRLRSKVRSHSADIIQANEILEEVCPQLKQMGLKPELWQVQRFLGWCRASLNYPADEQETLTVSTNQLLAQMTASLTPEDQVFYLLNRWTTDEEYIAAEINQLQRMQLRLHRVSVWLRPWQRLELMRRLNALVEHIDRYKDVLAKRTIKGDRIKVPFLPPASLWLRLLTHPKDRITLSFLILPDRVLVVRTGRFLFDFHVIPITRLEVRNQVQHWYKLIKNINDGRDIDDKPINSIDDNGDINYHRDMNVNWQGEYEEEMAEVANVGQEVAKTLAEMLAIPKLLEGLPKHIRALTIVPDDILHGFPFAAIRYKEKYLIEHYAISIAYESKGRRSPPNSIISKQKALVVGVSNGNKQFSFLKGVKPELKQVEDWLDRNHIHRFSFVNSSKTTVVENLSQATLLHIACHGTFELNQPDQSGLVFISDSKEQEILSLRELSEMNLTNLRHATLSSCWSADHFILPGRWIISLPETLWRSGTQSILGCLWKVDDKIAVSFMARFYNYLDKFPRDEALHRTQLDCLNNCLPNCNVNTDSLFLWAGFNLYGDYTALN